MGRFIIKLLRLILKYGRFSLVCVVIQLNGNSKYIEYMNNDFKEDRGHKTKRIFKREAENGGRT